MKLFEISNFSSGLMGFRSSRSESSLNFFHGNSHDNILGEILQMYL